MDTSVTDTGTAIFPNDDPARQLTALRQDLESFQRSHPGGVMARLLAGRILALEEETASMGVLATERRPGGRARRA